MKATTFAIHLTYQCPLTCDHCCFSSGPNVTDKLDYDNIVRTIRSLNRDQYKLVAFTGGEPFLFGDKLFDFVSIANEMGFATRIVTSAFWSVSEEISFSKLSKLKSCGLNEISISWDDYHERQSAKKISFQNVVNAVAACHSLGISSAINIVREADSYWTRARVLEELEDYIKDGDLIVVESPINLTGRAKEVLSDSQLIKDSFIGPCPYVLTGPTLSAKNKLLACCGVIPETSELVFSSEHIPENVNDVVEQMDRSALLNWLHIRGPYHIMSLIATSKDLNLPNKESIGGNCEACSILFSNPEYSQHIGEIVLENLDLISDEVTLYHELGFLDSSSDYSHITTLWSDVHPLRIN